MSFTKIKETCIYSKDLGAAKKFYEGTLGLPVISYVEAKHVFFRVGESVLLCFNPDDSRHKKSPPGHYAIGKTHFAFEVSPADYPVWEKKLDAAGVPITDRVVWTSGQESLYFEDPAGNVLEIVPKGVWE